MGYATEGTARAALAAAGGPESDRPLGTGGGFATEATLRALVDATSEGGGGTVIPDGTDGQVLKWSNGAWRPGADANTTYPALTAADAAAGTATAAATVSAKVLADEIDRRIAAALEAQPDPEV